MDSIIRCKVSEDAVWMHLIAEPEQASQVAEIIITEESDSEDEDSDEEGQGEGQGKGGGGRDRDAALRASELRMMEAIHHTKNLESFTWDRRAPYINLGDDVPGGTEKDRYREDIWTALRNFAPLKSLRVLDHGKGRSRYIFNSAMFTIKHLVHLDLELYFPADHHSGSDSDSDYEYDSDHCVVPPVVDLDRIRRMIAGCMLQSFGLSLKDEKRYSFPGHPFVNVTRLIENSLLSHLTSLRLRNVTVNSKTAEFFLMILNNDLRVLSATLSWANNSLPETAFGLRRKFPEDLFVNLERVVLSSRDLYQILPAIDRPCKLTEIGILEPAHWNASKEMENDYNYVTILDHVWGIPLDDVQQGEGEPQEPLSGYRLQNLLTGTPELRRVEVRDVQTTMQLQRLIRSTPTLEHLVFHDSFNEDKLLSGTLPLEYLSRWTKLETITVNGLFPEDDESDVETILQDLARTCPVLRQVTWNGGSATISRTGDGGLSIHIF